MKIRFRPDTLSRFSTRDRRSFNISISRGKLLTQFESYIGECVVERNPLT